MRSVASIEQPAQRSDGIPRMTPAAQLMNTQLHHLLFKAMPTRLPGSVRLIGAQPSDDFVLGDNAQQDIGIVGRLT